MAVTIAGCVGIVVGVGLVFLTAYVVEQLDSWRYHLRRNNELRERPRVPPGADRYRLERVDNDDRWVARACDSNDCSYDYDSDKHPMDALRNLLNHRMVDTPGS